MPLSEPLWTKIGSTAIKNVMVMVPPWKELSMVSIHSACLLRIETTVSNIRGKGFREIEYDFSLDSQPP